MTISTIRFAAVAALAALIALAAPRPAAAEGAFDGGKTSRYCLPGAVYASEAGSSRRAAERNTESDFQDAALEEIVEDLERRYGAGAVRVSSSRFDVDTLLLDADVVVIPVVEAIHVQGRCSIENSFPLAWECFQRAGACVTIVEPL